MTTRLDYRYQDTGYKIKDCRLVTTVLDTMLDKLLVDYKINP